ncbi:hypothetical protein K501DRAFT_279507 [Backusella circina FSU 941]|nr:hypothetical protein K501DRAFT_279507 [Backusella circina FSU 941]
MTLFFHWIKESNTNKNSHLFLINFDSAAMSLLEYLNYLKKKETVSSSKLVVFYMINQYFDEVVSIDHRYGIMSSKRKEQIFGLSHNRMVVMHHKNVKYIKTVNKFSIVSVFDRSNKRLLFIGMRGSYFPI